MMETVRQMNTESDMAADMHVECQIISPDVYAKTNLARKAIAIATILL